LWLAHLETQSRLRNKILFYKLPSYIHRTLNTYFVLLLNEGEVRKMTVTNWTWRRCTDLVLLTLYLSGRKILQRVAVFGSFRIHIFRCWYRSMYYWQKNTGSANTILKCGFLLSAEIPGKDVIINSGSISI
jgi:hypothetical protein